jgi:maleylpyruvate isomerase
VSAAPALGDADRASVVAACAARAIEVVDALEALDPDALAAPSVLPGWSRLTIACHLRYGAEALARMTSCALEGTRASFYPEGRAVQRTRTLEPGAGEEPGDVVRSLWQTGDALQRTWHGLSEPQWRTVVEEPDDNPDLGTVELAWLPLLRLTELEVHGGDLNLGLGDWSELFVQVALPTRLDWLNSRRSNHGAFAPDLEGSWLLVATDGPTYRVTVRGSSVESRRADERTRARATIVASSRDLLALLLGRPRAEPLRLSGDLAFAGRFDDAFPGP